MKTVRVGIVGAGRVADTHHLPVLALMPDVKLAWICDLNKARAARLARPYGINEVQEKIADCSDVDVVLLATPIGLRDQILKDIFARRWHTFIEKPLARSLEEHDRISQLAAQAGVEIGVGLQRRFYPTTLLAQQLVADSVFGAPRQIWATEGLLLTGSAGPGGAAWSVDRKVAGGGVVLETACHIIDQVLTICRPKELELRSCELVYYDDIDFEAKTRGSLALADGTRCQFGLAVSWLGHLYNAIVIEFATVRLKVPIAPLNAGLELLDLSGKTIACLNDSSGRTAPSGIYQPFYDEWRDFLAQSVERKPSRVAAKTTRLTTAFIEECYRRQPPPSVN